VKTAAWIVGYVLVAYAFWSLVTWSFP